MSELWRDPTCSVEARVADLVDRMTVEEKVAQLGSIWWLDVEAGGMAPMLSETVGPMPPWEEVVADGLGQLTRTFGTAPLAPADGMRILAQRQRDVMAGNRFGIPAQAHEEVLTGLAVWGATIYPAPLAWAASFDPALVERMAAQIAGSMRQLGIHQGLAPVLDVVRDHRWGRVEETLGEDPFLVGLVGSAYVRGLERGGAVATLKHFLGYSASRAGTQPGAGVHRSARAGRRHPAAVRDGAAGRRPVGDELLHRPGRRAGRRRPAAALGPAARPPRVRRHRDRRLLLGGLPAVAAPRRRVAR